MDFFRDAA